MSEEVFNLPCMLELFSLLKHFGISYESERVGGYTYIDIPNRRDRQFSCVCNPFSKGFPEMLELEDQRFSRLKVLDHMTPYKSVQYILKNQGNKYAYICN